MAERRSRSKTPGQRVLNKLIGKQKGIKLQGRGQVAHMFVVTVDPEMAQMVIDTVNEKNRRIRQKKVGDFASDMEAGRWLLQDDIMFSDDGTLIEGQHRFLAVIMSGVTIDFKMQLIEGKGARASFMSTGEGTPRNLADMLTVNEVRDSARIAPVLVLERNYRVTHSPFQSAAGRKRDYLKLFRSIGQAKFKEAFEAVPRGTHSRLSVNRAVIDWLALQLIQIDKGHAEVFFGLVVNPSQLKDDEAPYVLNQRLLELVGKRSRMGQSALPKIEQGTMFVKAWNHYYESSKMTVRDVNYRVREDFPFIEGSA